MIIRSKRHFLTSLPISFLVVSLKNSLVCSIHSSTLIYFFNRYIIKICRSFHVHLHTPFSPHFLPPSFLLLLHLQSNYDVKLNQYLHKMIKLMMIVVMILMIQLIFLKMKNLLPRPKYHLTPNRLLPIPNN